MSTAAAIPPPPRLPSFARTSRKRRSEPQSTCGPSPTTDASRSSAKQQLPLKKRMYMSVDPPSDGDAPPEPVLTTSAQLLSPATPVDFSLPNRSRAKASPSKYSHTDTESPTSDHSLEATAAPRPLDLSKPAGSTAMNPAALWSPFLLQSAFLPPPDPTATLAALGMGNPFLAAAAAMGAPGGLGPDLLKLLLAAVAADPSAVAADAAAPAQEGPSSGSDAMDDESATANFVINPATGNKVRRNYKNMTRERRMEANARERTRVHTIGAAFESLQKLVPSLAPEAKLSKLSILRIGCKYILLLAAMAGHDYSEDGSNYSVQECVEMLNDTILAEGKVKRLDRRS